MANRNERSLYYHGKPGEQYGIWNSMKKEFQFGIVEATPMLAVARLYQKIGDNAKKYRFEPKRIPKDLIPIIKNGSRKDA